MYIKHISYLSPLEPLTSMTMSLITPELSTKHVCAFGIMDSTQSASLQKKRQLGKNKVTLPAMCCSHLSFVLQEQAVC